jgi:programmed cell death 6-interacting protein
VRVSRLQSFCTAGLSSREVSIYYDQTGSTILEASPSIKHLFPSVGSVADYGPSDLIEPQNWLAHVQSKGLHFDAAAQYRKANEELENGRYVQVRPLVLDS